MKFSGTPNTLISMVYRIGLVRKTKPIGRFNKDGIYETEDNKIIARMKRYFPTIELFDTKDEVETITINKEIIRHCKKCSFTCTNQGDLMKHYRDEHPKGEQNATEPITQ